MKIHQLEVRNFRGFEHQTFHFSDQFTVLIGENGTGKTAILQAVATGVSPILLFWQSDKLKLRPVDIDENDVRHIGYQKGQIPTLEPQYPLVVSCQGFVDKQQISWMWKLLTIKTVRALSMTFLRMNL